MGIIELGIILVHPILALILLWWMFQQLSWKKKGTTLRGKEREESLEVHERVGTRLLPALLIVVICAFLSNIWRGINEGLGWDEYFFPSNLHSATGIIGTILFFVTWRLGREIVEKRQANESWQHTKSKHRRAAELIIILGCIHAFIGFILIFRLF